MATTYTVSSGDVIRPWRNVRVQEYPVHTSQTVLQGSVLKADTAGYENRAVLSTDTTTAKILGVAAEAITTTSTHNAVTDRVLVYLATEDAEFIARTDADTAVDFTMLGGNYELEIDGTNSITRVQLDGTTYEVVKLLQFIDPVTKNKQATEGDYNVFVVFKFIPGATVYGTGVVLA